MSRSRRTALRTFAGLLLSACAAAPARTAPGLAPPPHTTVALPGSELLARVRGLSLAEREIVLAQQFEAGDLPPFLCTLVPIDVAADIDGVRHTATFWCSKDYLGFGDDGDWLRMPMTPTLAQRFADRLDCTLPTRKMVDAIWAQATVKLEPIPFSPKQYDILDVDLFHRHHEAIEAQRGAQPARQLIAGIKKDVVISPLVAAFPGHVCIYGWHHADGKAIQPLTKVHTFGHVDYSHGIRLVARRLLVDGRWSTVDTVLADAKLHTLLSDEGALPNARYGPPPDRP